MPTHKTSFISITLTIIAIGAIGAYIIFSPQTITYEDDGEVIFNKDQAVEADQDDFIDEFLGQEIALDRIPEEELTPESFPNVQQYCVDIITPQPGSTISFPLEVRGEILDRGCWRIFEGEAGFIHIEKNGVRVSPARQTLEGLMRVEGSWLDYEDYPVSFSATISALTQNISGNAELIIAERDDLGEEGGSYIPDEIVIPVFVQ